MDKTAVLSFLNEQLGESSLSIATVAIDDLEHAAALQPASGIGPGAAGAAANEKKTLNTCLALFHAGIISKEELLNAQARAHCSYRNYFLGRFSEKEIGCVCFRYHRDSKSLFFPHASVPPRCCRF